MGAGHRPSAAKLLFADHQQIHRHDEALQGALEPDHLLIAVVYDPLDHKQINVAVVISIATGV